MNWKHHNVEMYEVHKLVLKEKETRKRWIKSNEEEIRKKMKRK